MASTKSKVACRFAVQEFVESRWKEKRRRCFMWTFTFVVPHKPGMSQDAASSCFNGFWTAIRKRLGLIEGVKVTENHPGGHGVHYHLVTDRYLPMQLLRELGRPWGFGFMWVSRLSKKSGVSVGKYVAKYLTKAKYDEDWKGVRLWSKLGEWMATRCKDVVIDCCVTRSIQAFKVNNGLNCRLPFWCIGWIVHLAQRWGDYGEWPDVIREGFLLMVGRQGLLDLASVGLVE